VRAESELASFTSSNIYDIKSREKFQILSQPSQWGGLSKRTDELADMGTGLQSPYMLRRCVFEWKTPVKHYNLDFGFALALN
jgi:hypothetical protein